MDEGPTEYLSDEQLCRFENRFQITGETRQAETHLMLAHNSTLNKLVLRNII